MASLRNMVSSEKSECRPVSQTSVRAQHSAWIFPVLDPVKYITAGVAAGIRGNDCFWCCLLIDLPHHLSFQSESLWNTLGTWLASEINEKEPSRLTSTTSHAACSASPRSSGEKVRMLPKGASLGRDCWSSATAFTLSLSCAGCPSTRWTSLPFLAHWMTSTVNKLLEVIKMQMGSCFAYHVSQTATLRSSADNGDRRLSLMHCNSFDSEDGAKKSFSIGYAWLEEKKTSFKYHDEI